MKHPKFEEFVASFPEVALDENQLELLKARYFLPGEDWKAVASRVAWAIAQGSVEYKDRDVVEEAKEYFELIYNMNLMPSTPFLMNAGAKKQNLFACYVLDIDDNLESIYDMLGISAKIFAVAGGCGYNFGNLRPAKTVTNVRNESSGVLNFMQLFDASCATIKAGSSGRRGAMLAALPVDHPEILEFIKCKENSKSLNNFNISVLINDEFMAAVRLGGEYKLREFKNYDGPKTMDARKVYKALVRSAWKNGEPGIIFIDTANRYNPVPAYGQICATNPCFTGDMRLLTIEGYKTFAELCSSNDIRLVNPDGDESEGTVWLVGEKETVKVHFENGKTITCTPDHKFKIFSQHNFWYECESKEAKDLCGFQVMFDSGDITGYKPLLVTDVTPNGIQKVYDFNEPITNWGIVEDVLVSNCGEVVGIRNSVCCLAHVNFAKLVKDNDMDWANMEKQIRAGIKFLDNSLDVNFYIDKRFEKTAKNTRQIGLGFMGLADAMTKLHIRYGSPESIEFCEKVADFFQRISHDESESIAKTRGVYPKFEGKTQLRRNSVTNTIAPTGSVGMLANASYGIEPHFALSYVKNCAEGRKFQYDNVDLINQLGSKLTKEDLEEIRQTGQLPERLFKDNQHFITANQIPYRERIKVQAAWQKHIDLSISSTINLPETATKEEVYDIYLAAWEKGLKGLTIYRNNSRTMQVLNVKDVKNTYVCDSCGKIHVLDEGVDPSQICIKCSCGYKSCA